jgi:hypothetical protein
MSSLSYQSEKLTIAVRGLAASPLHIQQRLAHAAQALTSIIPGGPHPMPTEELQTRWDEWWTSISHHPADDDTGTIGSTTSRMTDAEAREVAEELFSIYAEVERRYVLSGEA